MSAEELAQFVANHAVVLLFGSLGLLGIVPVVLLLFWRLSPEVQVPRALNSRGYLLIHLAEGLLVSIAILVFFFLSRLIVGETAVVRFDLALAKMLYDSTTPLGRTFFAIVTHTGSFASHATVAVLVGVLLARRGHRNLLVGWGIAMGGILVLITILKSTFERARPDVGSPIILHDFSFPSAHTLSTLVVSGFLAYFVLRFVSSPGPRIAVPGLALVWTLLVGFSRMYLGVHYFSDVVAGFAAGAVWLAVCISGFEAARRRSNR